MKPRPKPLLGLLLGFLLGLVVVALLWQLGVAPPDRFTVFAILALAIAGTTLLVTQTLRRGRRRFVTSMIIAGVAAGVALTGIPETFWGTGSLSDGCHLEITSGEHTVTPEQTSPFGPLNTTPTGTLTWVSSTDEVLTNWDSSIGIVVIGIPITLWSADRPNAEQATSWTGSEEVADYLAKIEDETGLQLRGTFHVAAGIEADGGDCDMAGYLRVTAEGAFATPLIVALWVTGGLLVVIIGSLAVSARRSIRQSALYGGTVAAAPDVSTPADPVGAFTPATPLKAPEPVPVAEPVAHTKPIETERVVTKRPMIREHTVYADRPADDEIPMLEPDVEPELEPQLEPVEDQPTADATEDAEAAPASGDDDEPRTP